MTYQEFIKLAQKKGIDNIQIAEETQIENSIYFINKKIEDYTDSEKIHFLIKAEKNGKTEQLYTEYLDESIIDLLLEKMYQTESKYEDEYLDRQEQIQIEEEQNIDISNEVQTLKETINIIDNINNLKSLEAAYGETYTKTRIINNKGVDIATSSHNYELYVEVNLQEGTNISTHSEKIIANNKQEIDFKNTINQVIELATYGLKRKKLENKLYNIILSNKVTTQILSSFSTMISALNINQKTSCMENKLNKKIFSEQLTILEEPRNKRFPGYTIFDKEGILTYNKELIKNGVIKSYLYDIKEAKVAKTTSTGNKYNGIGTRNMYIVPGNHALHDLFKKMENGIYITSYMGSSGTSINCNSGNISMQIFGYIIEDGKITSSFDSAIMTTTIFELFSNIKHIGNDLKFLSLSVGAPSLYIENISIAAE